MSRREGGGRRFVAILFTDIVGSTDIASELGDRKWRDLVRRHHAIVRRELKRFDGAEMDTAGDGFFAVFEGSGPAIRCAAAISDAVREVGLEVRAGLHGGEVEIDGGKAGGIAVNTAARVMGLGGPGEVLVSSTLRDVVAGSTLEFVDHGVHGLKGIEGEWRLFALRGIDGERIAEPLDPDEASRRRMANEPSEPARPRRLGAIFVGGVAAIALAVVLIFVLTTRETEEPVDAPGGVPPAAGPPPNSLAKVDTRTGEVLLVRADVAATSAPQFANDDLVTGLGSVWLLRPPQVSKVDLEDGSHTAVDLPSGFYMQGIDVGLEAMWILGPWLYRVNPATGRIESRLRLPLDIGNRFYADVGVGADAVWVATRGPFVIRVDPTTERGTLIPLGHDPLATPEVIGVGTNAVWLLDESSGVVWRVDQRTSEVLEPIPVSGGLDRIAVGEGFAWVLDTALGTLTPISEGDGEAQAGIDVGTDATDVAVGMGSVWVSSGGKVLEINAATFQIVRTMEIGATPILRLAIDEDDAALWLDVAKNA